MDCLGGEDEVLILPEIGVDVTEDHSLVWAQHVRFICLLRIPVARDDTSVDTLRETVHHPSRGAALRVASQILLGYDGDGISGCAREILEDIVVDMRLVLVVGFGTRAVDGDDA